MREIRKENMRLQCVFISINMKYFFQVLDTWFTILADLWWLSGYVLLAHSKFKLIEPIDCLA